MDDDDFISKNSQGRSGSAAPLFAPKRPVKKMDNLPSDGDSSIFGAPLFKSDKFDTENDSFGLPKISPHKIYEECCVCKKDISHLSSTRKSLHLNKCLDQTETRMNYEKAKEKHSETVDCPVCGEPQPPGPYRDAHAKRCAKQHNVTPPVLLEMMEVQTKAVQLKKKRGVSHTKAALPVRKEVQAPKLKGQPKSFLDEETQLAKALSASMAPPTIESLKEPSPQFKRIADPNENRRKRPRSYAIVELAPRSCKCEVISSLHTRFLEVFRVSGKRSLKEHCEKETKNTCSFASYQAKLLDKLTRLEHLSSDLAKLLDSHSKVEADVHITCSDGVVPAHRNVIQSRTRGFLSKESSVRVEYGVEIVRSWLKYIYCGRVEWSQEENDILLDIGIKYGPECLPSTCRFFFSASPPNEPETTPDELVNPSSSQDQSAKDSVPPLEQQTSKVNMDVKEEVASVDSQNDLLSPSLPPKEEQHINEMPGKKLAEQIVVVENSCEPKEEPIEQRTPAADSTVSMDCEDPLDGLNLSDSTVNEEMSDDEVLIIEDSEKEENSVEKQQEKDDPKETIIDLSDDSRPPTAETVPRPNSPDLFESGESLIADDTPREDLDPSWVMTPLKLSVLPGESTDDETAGPGQSTSKTEKGGNTCEDEQPSHLPQDSWCVEPAVQLAADDYYGQQYWGEQAASPVQLDDDFPVIDLASPACPSSNVNNDDAIPSKQADEPSGCQQGDTTGEGANDPMSPDSFASTPKGPTKRRSSKIVDSFYDPLFNESPAICASNLETVPLAHSTPAQPVNKKLKFGSNVKIVKTSAITPMPDYEGMTDADIKAHLAKNGLRPMGRKKAIATLRQIYDTVHPVIDPSTPTIRPLARELVESKEENVKKGPKRKKTTVAEKEKNSGEAGVSSDVASSSGTAVHRLTFTSDSGDEFGNKTLNYSDGEEPLEESILEENGKLPKDIASMTSAFLSWLRLAENEELYNHMLSLQPVLIDELHLRVSRCDHVACTIPRNALGPILDRLGATFSLPQPASGKRKMGGGGAFRKKK